MKRISMMLGAAGLAAVLGGAAIAEQGMQRGGHDPFGTATITRAEAQAKAAEMFGRLDLTGDGKLDAADRAAMIGKRFDAMDANHDGSLSRQEFTEAHQKMMAAAGDHAMGAGRMGHRGHRGMGGGMKMLARMDTNGDRAISRDEFVAGALKRFDAADANHDGKVTPEERRAARRDMMMKHRQMMGQGGMDHGGMDHDMDDMPPPPPPSPSPPK